MKTKQIQTKDYILIIDEEAEIKEGDYILEKELIINIFPDYLTDLDECSKIIAYYPLTKEAKELDLPLLPNPFEVINIEELAEKAVTNNPLDWIKGYKAAQTKQFSLEDMKKAIEMAREDDGTDSGFYINSTEEIIQSLSTQQLPVSFEPEYNYPKHLCYNPEENKVLKTITNSEGKEELVGTYKY